MAPKGAKRLVPAILRFPVVIRYLRFLANRGLGVRYLKYIGDLTPKYQIVPVGLPES